MQAYIWNKTSELLSYSCSSQQDRLCHPTYKAPALFPPPLDMLIGRTAARGILAPDTSTFVSDNNVNNSWKAEQSTTREESGKGERPQHHDQDGLLKQLQLIEHDFVVLPT